MLPSCVDGVPTQFEYHPFRYIDHKEQAYIRKRAVQRKARKLPLCGQRFYADFGFLRASTDDYARPSDDEDRIVQSFDGFNSYLLLVDDVSSHVWVFLCKSKEPPTDTVSQFLAVFGLEGGGVLRCDQGGELARSHSFITAIKKKNNYVVEPTGSDTPSQNGAAKTWNGTFAVTVRALLYGSGLQATYWSVALVHAVFLHNRRFHQRTRVTPYEGWYGVRPNLQHLRMFGARVCVKRAGSRRAKLDHHDFRGIFLGYPATMANIVYLDLDSGRVKTCGHATFDEAWYCQPTRPPAAQTPSCRRLRQGQDRRGVAPPVGEWVGSTTPRRMWRARKS